MSILAEAISVIVPVAVLEAKYPGGAAGYARDCPNGTYCSDGRLTRVGFMVPADVAAFVGHLGRFGFVHVHDGKAADLVVVDQLHGPTSPCDWIEGGRHSDGYSAVWQAGTEPGPLAHPPGWTPEQSAQLHFVPNQEVDERFLQLGQENNVDVVLDFKTGKQVYIGRVRPGD